MNDAYGILALLGAVVLLFASGLLGGLAAHSRFSKMWERAVAWTLPICVFAAFCALASMLDMKSAENPGAAFNINLNFASDAATFVTSRVDGRILAAFTAMFTIFVTSFIVQRSRTPSGLK